MKMKKCKLPMFEMILIYPKRKKLKIIETQASNSNRFKALDYITL